MPLRRPAGFISAFYDPLKNPNAPTIGTASPVSATSLSITFTAPAVVGGSPITSYVATARRTSDGVLFNASGTSSPITITGLTAVAFTVRVVAVNSYGPSASSAASNSVTPADPVIGQAFGGGFFAGQIGVSSVATHNLVVSPRSSGQNSLAWKTSDTNTAGTTSAVDGPANTAAMIAAGAAAHPCAQFCDNVVIGGFSDWYMPARNELDVCYFNLKPTTATNTQNGGQPNFSAGINPNAIPARATFYAVSVPTMTSATNFQSTGAEPFSSANYWNSTQFNAERAVNQNFGFGYVYYGNFKTGSRNVRAVRRVPV